jgi:hypothetical protein
MDRPDRRPHPGGRPQRQHVGQTGVGERALEGGVLAVEAVSHDRSEGEPGFECRVDQLDREPGLRAEVQIGLALRQPRGRRVGLDVQGV